MARWDDLFRRMRQVEAERLELERRQRDREAARRAVDAWADGVLPQIWQGLVDEVARRVKDFAKATGKRVSVCSRDEYSWTSRAGGMRILELKIDDSVAYIYSHRVSGSLPLFHVAHWNSSRSGQRNAHRVMSVPICMVEREGNHGYLLRRTAPQAPDVIRLEDIVFRAFELLVFGIGRPDARVLALRAMANDTRRQFNLN